MPINLQLEENQKLALSEITALAKEKGINSFVLMFHPEEGSNAMHIEKLKTDDVLSLSIWLLDRMINGIVKSPQYSDGYKQMFNALEKDLFGAIENHNKNIKALLEKDPTGEAFAVADSTSSGDLAVNVSEDVGVGDKMV